MPGLEKLCRNACRPDEGRIRIASGYVLALDCVRCSAASEASLEPKVIDAAADMNGWYCFLTTTREHLSLEISNDSAYTYPHG